MKIFKQGASLLVCLVLLLSSCGQPPIDDSVIAEPSDATVQEVVEPEPVPVIDSEPKPIRPYEGIIVFDLAEFPEEDFPQGFWSINQLANK